MLYSLEVHVKLNPYFYLITKRWKQSTSTFILVFYLVVMVGLVNVSNVCMDKCLLSNVCSVTKINILEMPIDCQLKIFDQLVQPILLYSSEVWGYENIVCLERLHLNFCKYILKLKMSTPDFMVFGELGRYQLSICV